RPGIIVEPSGGGAPFSGTPARRLRIQQLVSTSVPSTSRITTFTIARLLDGAPRPRTRLDLSVLATAGAAPRRASVAAARRLPPRLPGGTVLARRPGRGRSGAQPGRAALRGRRPSQPGERATMASSQTWELWFPDAAATGLLFARARIPPTAV